MFMEFQLSNLIHPLIHKATGFLSATGQIRFLRLL